jgi:hypothetical protein
MARSPARLPGVFFYFFTRESRARGSDRPGPEAQPEARPEAQPEAGPQAQPEALPEARPEAGPQAQTEAEPEALPEARPEAGTGSAEMERSWSWTLIFDHLFDSELKHLHLKIYQ